MFGAGRISKLVLKVFDKSVWLLRRLDVLMPWPGLSLMAVARKAAPANAVTGERHSQTARNVG